MSLSDKVRSLNSIISIILNDTALLEGGRKSRSPAIRKNLSILSKECGSLRKSCLETQKAIPTKTRAPKQPKPVAPEPVAPEPVAPEPEPAPAPAKTVRSRRNAKC